MAYPISDVPRRIVYSGSAGVGPYAFTFEVLANTDIAVYKNTTLLTLTTDYTVSINTGTGTGTVTLVVAATGADTVTIVGDRAIQRTSDFVTGGDLFANTLNEELDAQTIYTQQVDEKADRAIKIPVTDPTNLSMTLPSQASRAQKLLGFNASGEPTAYVATTTVSDTSLINFTQAGTGAVTRTAQAKMRDVVSVLDFGADPSGVADSTAAIQAALNTGKSVDLVGGQYKANNLTMSTALQSLFSSQGFARITKNANGPILTISANDVLVQNVGFRGESATPAFTGDNVVVTGNSSRFINCGSRYAYARALKISGDSPSIMGSGDIWQTADATSNGFDIEIGNASTTIAYPRLINIVTSQAQGGVLLTNTGSHVLSGGQIGKLTINTAGGPPAGTNGGMTANMRILGDVTVSSSTARFVGNQFGAVAITLSAGTSGIELDQSNSFQSGSTVVNSGNANNLIIRETLAGSGFNSIKIGADASNAIMDVYSGNGDTGEFGFRNGVWVNNNKVFRAKDSGGTLQNIAYISPSNVNFLSNTNGDTVVNAGTLLVLVAGGSGRWGVEANYLYPRADNAYSLGLGSYRPTVLYAVSGTINTSDAREKQQVRTLSEAEHRAAVQCKQLIRAFKWNDAVEKKGDGARIHFGVMAQDVKAAFDAEGLDADKYGLFCYDEWDAQEEVVDAETGFVVQPARAAGNRYGVRYEQLLAFIIAAL